MFNHHVCVKLELLNFHSWLYFECFDGEWAIVYYGCCCRSNTIAGTGYISGVQYSHGGYGAAISIQDMNYIRLTGYMGHT